MAFWGKATAILKVEPLFGTKAWGADSTCDDVHPNGPIPEGDPVCCMACHKTGSEGHRYLRITDEDRVRLAKWKPAGGKDGWSRAEKAEPTKYVEGGEEKPKTRREKRSEKFASQKEFEARLAIMDPVSIADLVDSGHAVPTGMLGAEE